MHTQTVTPAHPVNADYCSELISTDPIHMAGAMRVARATYGEFNATTFAAGTVEPMTVEVAEQRLRKLCQRGLLRMTAARDTVTNAFIEYRWELV